MHPLVVCDVIPLHLEDMSPQGQIKVSWTGLPVVAITTCGPVP